GVTSKGIATSPGRSGRWSASRSKRLLRRFPPGASSGPRAPRWDGPAPPALPRRERPPPPPPPPSPPPPPPPLPPPPPPPIARPPRRSCQSSCLSPSPDRLTHGRIGHLRRRPPWVGTRRRTRIRRRDMSQSQLCRKVSRSRLT